MTRPAVSILVLACLLAQAAVAPAEPVGSIPDPRPAGFAVDLTGTVPAATIEGLNRLGAEVKARTTGEVVVVVVRTTGGAAPRAFATELFNAWEIGDRDRHNGVLLFVALDDRGAEIILGDGVNSDAEVRVSDRIMAEEVVARFRAGDAPGGIFCGALALAEEILKVAPGALGGDIESSGAIPARPAAPAAEPRASPAPAGDGGDSGLGPLGLAGAGVGVAGVSGLVLRSLLRRRPRKCPGCGRKMVRLSEEADDQHLTGPERVEEKIGSVDYDIWHCAACNQALKVRYGAFFTSYGKCGKCGYKTKSSTSTTIRAATYSSGGQVRVDESCRNCSFRNSYTRSTPRLVKPSSSSSRSSSSSSSSSSRSSGSRSGGSSSGRGSSGRW
jgi:uncharacterized protein